MCRRWSLHASLPSGTSAFSSMDADGYTTASKVCSSSMPSGTVSFLGMLSGPGYAISSNAPDSEIHASVFHTLDVETDGWLSLLCPTSCGRGSWSFQRHQDTPSRSSRLPDVLSESSTADPGSLAVWVLAASSIRHRGSSWRVTKDSNVGRHTAPVKLGSCVCGLLAEHDKIGHRVCVQTVLEFSAKCGCVQ